MYGLDYRIIRLANPYGPYQRPNGVLGAVTTFTYKALKGEQIQVYGDGSVIRDFIYIDDAVRAILNIVNGDNKHRTFNLGCGYGTSIKDVLKSIEHALNLSCNMNYGICYIALAVCILITLYKLRDIGFDFSNITLFGELDRLSYGSKLANLLYEFIAYPLYNTFICVTVVDFFFGKRDKWLIVLTVVMCGSWMLISGGRIAIIRLLISIVLCMALKTSTKRKIAKLFSNIRFVAVFAVACAAFVYLTVLKGFEPLFNIYSDFAIQPKMFQYWGKEIAGQYAYGAASLFGFIYPFLYLIKNLFGLSKLPLGSNVYANIDKTFNDWITLGTYYRCNAYSSCFWYLYYDGRTIGIIIGMLLWGIFCKSIFSRMLECFDKKHISIYILMMIGVIYSFTDMEFSKANYVLAFLFISKVCFCKTKIVFGKTGGKKIE